ncbi:ABC transporter substrate-binding protein [Rhodococcus sp. CSLK01-03]|uniref:ABC transporter substrate-binding protein n=1 Tax=Rhodococcus indonesiensis TaxID=3055869 RepID=A0ABT7RKG8_9NOCA|nr:ABC transporter substrate-binding protein [Rhodococcus indonesiensis]MDM7488140.1 ABC transporter substrate-binding protein [Rhodococcus indonesiensis]
MPVAMGRFAVRRWTAAVGTCAVLVAACGSEVSENSGVADPAIPLRYATVFGASSFDPHKTKVTSDATMLNLVYDRLVHRDVDAQPVPGLAESWELTDESLTLHLREGVSFADGSPVDAAAVQANLNRALEPDSVTAPMLAGVTGITTPDERTVVLALDRPGAQLVLALSDLPGMIVDPDAFGTPEKNAALALTPAGAGRYTVTRAQPGAEYEFTARPGYWDPDAVRTDSVVWTVMTDPQARLAGVTSGDLHAAITTPLTIDAAEQQGLRVETALRLDHMAVNLNRSRGEFGKLEVRQALAYAIDRQAIADTAMEGHAEAATQNFPKDYFAYDPDLAGAYPYDPDRARELLAQAGLPNGFSFTAILLNLPENVQVAQIVQQQLAEVGIDMQLKPMPPSEASPTFNRGDADAIVTTFTGRSDPALLFSALYGAQSPQNPSRSTAPGFQEALDAANRESDLQARADKLGDVSKLVSDNALAIPLVFFELGSTLTDEVVGYEPTLLVDEWRGVGVAAP